MNPYLYSYNFFYSEVLTVHFHLKVPAQINLKDNDRQQQIGGYTELLYAHLLDGDGSRLTYTHFTSRVEYSSIIEIFFNRPIYIQKNKVSLQSFQFKPDFS